MTSQVMDGAIARSDGKSRPSVLSLCSRFKTLMTNKSEQDGDSSKTIEISDMKYHIFQVGGSQQPRVSHSLALPPTSCGTGGQAGASRPRWGCGVRAWAH